jgi:hypothetical protein
MANRIPSPGDSPPRRILVQAALPKVSITPATGRGMCEFPPNRPSLLRNLAVANVMECSTTTGGGTGNSGKLYTLQHQSSRVAFTRGLQSCHATHWRFGEAIFMTHQLHRHFKWSALFVDAALIPLLPKRAFYLICFNY